MLRRIRLLPIFAVLLPFSSGCGLFGQHGIPKDPLFIARKPIEAKAIISPPRVIAYAKPPQPPNEDIFIVKSKPERKRLDQGEVHGVLTSNKSPETPKD